MVKKLSVFLLLLLSFVALVACNDDEADDDEELKILDVDFDIPDTAEVDEDGS